MSTEADVAAHVRTVLAGVPYLLTADSCRAGPPRKPTENQLLPGAVPARCVFALATGGMPATAFIDGGAGGRDERLTVQLWVRSNPRDYEGGRDLAEAVFGAVEMNPPPGFYESRAVSSEAAYVREDEQNHHEWSINITLRRCA